MIIVKYDAETSLDSVYEISMSIKDMFPTEQVVCVPRYWEILEGCKVEELELIRDELTSVIEKMKKEE